jgi:hypothetical protein
VWTGDARDTRPKAVDLRVAASYLEHTCKGLISEQVELDRAFDAALAETAPPTETLQFLTKEDN